jgi:transposase
VPARRVLLIVENCSVPFDQRVWQEAKALRDGGYSACVLSPRAFLPGYAPELNPDELVWSHMKRTGVARRPLRKGEQLQEKIEAQLAALKKAPRLVRSFFKAPTVAYITDL